MSRIGNRELTIPANVTVSVNGNVVSVKGPKGELSTEVHQGINVKVEDNKVICTRTNDNYKNFHGTANANIKNMIVGVTAGYSHPVEVNVPEGISLESPSNTELFIRGIDKCLVGEFAANIRKIREPEPYKGKGIRYTDEHIIRKVGKKASK